MIHERDNFIPRPGPRLLLMNLYGLTQQVMHKVECIGTNMLI